MLQDPLLFPLVSQTLAVSETHVELTSICVARVGHSSRPRHATRQASEQGRCKSHMTLAFVYHIIFQSSAFHLSLRHRAASQRGRPVCLVMEGVERDIGWWNSVICAFLTEMAYNMQCCALALLCMRTERGRWIQVELGVDVHCCFHLVSYWVKFHLQCWRHLHQIMCLFLVIPVMQFLLSSTNLCRCAVMCCHLKNLFNKRLYQIIIIYVHIIKKLDRLSNKMKIKNKGSKFSLKHFLEKKEKLRNIGNILIKVVYNKEVQYQM